MHISSPFFILHISLCAFDITKLRILAFELADGEGFKLGLKGEGDKTRLGRHEPRAGMPALGVKSKAQLKFIYTLLTLKCVNLTGTHFHTYGDKTGSPMVIKAKRETA